VYCCRNGGDASLRVFHIQEIRALVAMVPDFRVDSEGNVDVPENKWVLVEKPFLETGVHCGVVDEDREDDADI